MTSTLNLPYASKEKCHTYLYGHNMEVDEDAEYLTDITSTLITSYIRRKVPINIIPMKSLKPAFWLSRQCDTHTLSVEKQTRHFE